MQKEMRLSFSLILLSATLLDLIVFKGQCYAYLDPGAGSYIFQLFIGGILASGFIIKTQWNKIKKFVSKTLSLNQVPANKLTKADRDDKQDA